MLPKTESGIAERFGRTRSYTVRNRYEPEPETAYRAAAEEGKITGLSEMRRRGKAVHSLIKTT